MQNEKRYFASANTEKGFVSYFDEIYGGLDRLYIIKGGPGTGKSSLIRNIADGAERKGYTIEYFYCSSDPLSLDGIIIEELNCGIIDGTLPHSYEPRYPGVRDVIINLGDNWNSEKLRMYTNEICEITDTKKILYNNVYNYLSAAGRVENELTVCNGRCLLKEKMNMAVQRLGRIWQRGKGYKRSIRPIESISHAGRIVYGTYNSLAENKFAVKDRYGIGCIFMDMLIDLAKEKGLMTVYSPSVLDPSAIKAIYFPEVKSSFVICDDDSVDVRQINMDRFIDLDALRKNKQKNRFARRCLNSLYEGVQKGFDDIFALHSELEKYYTESMDFSENMKIAEEIKKELFGA